MSKYIGNGKKKLEFINYIDFKTLDKSVSEGGQNIK